MYNLFDIFKQIILITKNNDNIYLTDDINKYIFSFIINDYKKIININFIEKYLGKLIKSTEFLGKSLIIYYDYFPYPEFVKNINLREIIDSKLNYNSNLYYSHHLYNNDGIYYSNIDNYYKRIFNF